jgi:hypothetical protein
MSARPRVRFIDPRRHRCSIAGSPARRCRRTLARRPWSGAHPALQFRVDALRNLSYRNQSWSVKGLDSRRGSFKRRIEMEWLNSTLAGSTVPPIGAALRSIRSADQRDVTLAGEQARGRIHPIQPAPGKNASAQACKSAESTFGSALAFRRRIVCCQLNQIPRDKPCRDAQDFGDSAPAAMQNRGTTPSASQGSPRTSGRPAPASSHSQFRLAPFDSSQAED